MHGHLVAVEVGVEGGAAQGVQLQRLALHQHRLKGLDAEAVQRRGAVEHHGMVLDDAFQDVPDLGAHALHGALGGLDVDGHALIDQALDDEGLEQFQGHLLGQAALIEFQRRADDDNRTAGVVHALAQEVLAEAALLAAQKVGQALKLPSARAGDGAAAAAVVDEGVHGLLQHALFVADDDVRRAHLQHPL